MTSTSSTVIHDQLDHLVIDADGHWLEPVPVFLDFLRDEGGAEAVAHFMKQSEVRNAWYGMTDVERLRRRPTRPNWWGLPTSTLDRTTVMLPGLLAERLDEFGVDFSILYPTLGLQVGTIPHPDARRAYARAMNKMSAELFSGYEDRMTPVAVIPTYTPEEAIEEAEFVVRELGMKAALFNGTVRRPIPRFNDEPGKDSSKPYYVDTLVLDSDMDFDPVWAKFVELGLAVTTHTGSIGWADRRSTSNFVFNHIGHFAQSNHVMAKAIFLGGVTRRFPTLKFGFLEGGVGWACNLYLDLVSHWEKRSHEPMLKNLRPSNIDRAQMRALIESHGGPRIAAKVDEMMENIDIFYPGIDLDVLTEREQDLDDYARAEIESAEDFTRLFADNFYFGCEADDPTTAWAFDKRFQPLKAMFSSDLSHFDVVEMVEVLEEAYELVDHGLLDLNEFRTFTFENAAELHASTNPDFFKGTRVEKPVADYLSTRRA